MEEFTTEVVALMHRHVEDATMNSAGADCLREFSESITVLSLSHLQPSTRQKLCRNDLSVNAYPTEFGGLVYIGPHRAPTETDLALIGKVSALAGVDWLLFDAEGPVIEGLPVFNARQLLL